MYGQYGKGQNIPPSSVFDVKNAQVGDAAEADAHRHRTRSGSVWKSHRATLDVDYYHINFQSDYSSTIDPVTGDTDLFPERRVDHARASKRRARSWSAAAWRST